MEINENVKKFVSDDQVSGDLNDSNEVITEQNNEEMKRLTKEDIRKSKKEEIMKRLKAAQSRREAIRLRSEKLHEPETENIIKSTDDNVQCFKRRKTDIHENETRLLNLSHQRYELCEEMEKLIKAGALEKANELNDKCMRIEAEEHKIVSECEKEMRSRYEEKMKKRKRRPIWGIVTKRRSQMKSNMS